MTRIRRTLARGLNVVQLGWVAVLALVVATTAGLDGSATAVGAAVAVLVVIAFAGRQAAVRLRSLITASAGPPREEKRLRGAFRRQSAPDTPGRPRLPRAPGPVQAAA
ncbi:DUF6412 domain-containing protein [Nocardia sp. NPDC024068]|uniref:DUF6412 domain-containing protein n=1 Tax=Nocardia sp. NPDC024068 TaxID=3157197 RepID=UPI0033CBC836